LIALPVDDWDPMMMDPAGAHTEQLCHQLLRVSLEHCQTKRVQEEEEEEQGVSEEEGEEEVMLVWEVPSNSSLGMMV
jgi:hypothetical protein